MQNIKEARQLIRAGEYTGYTSGWCRDFVQANLCIVDKSDAEDFAEFCRLNPKPCPVLAQGDPGDPVLRSLGDINICTDLPRYRVWRKGKLVDIVSDISSYWTNDMVAFVLGCSFSFDQLFLDAGLPLPHLDDGSMVAMYRTWNECESVGKFRGRLVVSMRQFRADHAIESIAISSRYPLAHGTPVHIHIAGCGDSDHTPTWLYAVDRYTLFKNSSVIDLSLIDQQIMYLLEVMIFFYFVL